MTRNRMMSQFTSKIQYFDWIANSGAKLKHAYDRILRAMIKEFESKPTTRNILKHRYFNPENKPRVDKNGLPTMADDELPRMGHSTLTGRVAEMYCLKQHLLANKNFDTDEEYENALAAACDFPMECKHSTQDKVCMGLVAVVKIAPDPYSNGKGVQWIVPLTHEGRKYLRNQGGQVKLDL